MLGISRLGPIRTYYYIGIGALWNRKPYLDPEEPEPTFLTTYIRTSSEGIKGHHNTQFKDLYWVVVKIVVPFWVP